MQRTHVSYRSNDIKVAELVTTTLKKVKVDCYCAEFATACMTAAFSAIMFADLIRDRAFSTAYFTALTPYFVHLSERTLMYPYKRRINAREPHLTALDGRQDSSRTCPDIEQLANARSLEHDAQNEHMHMHHGVCR